VHFVDPPRLETVGATLRTHTVRFVDVIEAAGAGSMKCTVRSATWQLGR
jgi:hypothetical protein